MSNQAEMIEQWKATGRLSMDLLILAARHNMYVEYYASFGTLDGMMSSPDRAEQRERIGRQVRGEQHADELFEIRRSMAEIDQAIRRFEATVWRPWLQERYRQSAWRGHHAVAERVVMLVWGAAGRVLITLKCDDVQVTIIAAEDGDQGIGLQSIEATKDQAVSLIDRACACNGDLLSTFAPDRKVQIDLANGGRP